MTRWAFAVDTPYEIHVGRPFRGPDGAWYPANWLEMSSEADRASKSIKEMVEASPAPAGKRIVSTTLQLVNGAPTEVRATEDIPLAEIKATKLIALADAYAAALAVGYPKTFDGVAETLQCRNEHDRTNWFGVIEKCKVAAGLGFGDAPMSPPLRCTSNRKYTVSHNEAYAIMLEILDWAAAVMGHNWDLKDAIEAAGTKEALAAIDVNAGW